MAEISELLEILGRQAELIDELGAMARAYEYCYKSFGDKWAELVKEGQQMIADFESGEADYMSGKADTFPNGEKRMWHYECSACSTGEPPCPINKEHWDFCPNCGADMRGET